MCLWVSDWFSDWLVELSSCYVCVCVCVWFKVENVLRSSTGHYVLCDFGSAAGVMHTKVNIQQLQEEIARSEGVVIYF